MRQSTQTDPVLPWQECIELLERLPNLDPQDRTGAIELLVRNPSPWIRQRALRAGSAVLSDEQIVAYLRNEGDDILRNMGLEILKMKGAAALPLALRLLQDGDPDLVLQAVLALDSMRDLRALEPLRQTLRHPNPNVSQAAILAIGQIGDERVIPDILMFLEGDSWLQWAAVQTLGDLRSPKALAPLQRFLPDLFLGGMAAEAIARIGGEEAFAILSRSWQTFRLEMDPETVVGLLAHVLEGLEGGAKDRDGLAASLAPLLEDPNESVRLSSARCLVALGPGSWDGRALEILAATPLPHHAPYPGLGHRRDLIPFLLNGEEPLRTWGLHLAARFPDAAPPEAVERAVEAAPLPQQADLVLGVLSRLQGPDKARLLLSAYARSPLQSRGPIVPLLLKHRDEVRMLLDSPCAPDAVTQTVLLAFLGEPPQHIVEAVLAFGPEDRVSAIAQMADIHPVLRRLPWDSWLAQAPDTYSRLASEVAVRGRFEELLPPLRSLLARKPAPFLMETMGLLGDRLSVPILRDILDGEEPFLRAMALEALGAIGGPEARALLRRFARAAGTRETAVAYGALAHCAIEEDVPFFRDAAHSAEWAARLASAEVLGRYPSPDNLALLAMLAADPTAAVARRAATLLEG